MSLDEKIGKKMFKIHFKENIKNEENDNNNNLNQYINNSITSNNLILSNKALIIIKSLLIFNKDNFLPNISYYNVEINYETDEEAEKQIYNTIHNLISMHHSAYMDGTKFSLSSSYKAIQNLTIESNELNIKFAILRALVITINKIVLNYLKSILHYKINMVESELNEEDKNNNESYIKIKEITQKDFFNIYETFEKSLEFLNNIEYLFKPLINQFGKLLKIKCSLEEIFIDSFFDLVFRMKEITKKFQEFYFLEKKEKKFKILLNKYVDILYDINTPIKKLLGKFLNIEFIKDQKIFLADYIINLKKNSKKNNFYLNNQNNEINNKSFSEINIFDTKNIPNMLTGIKQNNNDKNDKDEEECKINVIEKLKYENKILNLEKKFNKYTNDNNENLNNDELYKYIIDSKNDDNIFEEKIKKKNKKKKKKRMENDEIINDENELIQDDPIVEQFKNEINLYSKNYSFEIQKLKPKLPINWLIDDIN